MGACIAVMMSMMLSACNPTPLRGLDKAENSFQENKELITLIRDFLIESEYDYITIDNPMNDTRMFINKGYVPIDNDGVIEALALLRQQRYEGVSMTNPCIKFHMLTYQEIYYGIVYPIDGHTPDESCFSFLTLIEPLTEDGWYYFEENYPEWRVRNQNRNQS